MGSSDFCIYQIQVLLIVCGDMQTHFTLRCWQWNFCWCEVVIKGCRGTNSEWFLWCIEPGPGLGGSGPGPDTKSPIEDVVKHSLEITTWVEIMTLVMNHFLHLFRTPHATLILRLQEKILLIWSLTSDPVLSFFKCTGTPSFAEMIPKGSCKHNPFAYYWCLQLLSSTLLEIKRSYSIHKYHCQMLWFCYLNRDRMLGPQFI